MNRQWIDREQMKPAFGGQNDNASISLAEIISVFKRRIGIIVSVVILCVVAAGIYVFTTKPVYQAIAVILIDPASQTRVFGDETSDALLLKDNLVVESEIEVIKSGQLLKRVANLAKIYDDPEYTTSSAPSLVRKWIYKQLSIPETKRNGDGKAEIFAGFRGRISAKRIGLTYAIQVSYEASDAQRTADVTNLIAQSYLDDKLENHYAAAKHTNEWLRQRLTSLQDEVIAAERAVELYKEKNDIVDVSTGLVSDQELSELNSQLILARAKTATDKARYDRIKLIILEKNADAALADVLSSKEIIDLRRKYATKQNQARKLESRYGSIHLAVINAKAEVGRIQTLILEEMSRIEQSYESAYEISKSSEKALEIELLKLKGVYVFSGQKQIKLRELKRQAEASSELYKSLLESFRKSSARETLPTTNARIIEFADRPIVPSKPRKNLILVLALVFGVGAGMGLAFLRESLDNMVWTPEGIEKLSGRNNLGLIPELSIKIAKRKRKRRWVEVQPEIAEEENMVPRLLLNPVRVAPFRETFSDRFSRFSEVLRNILVVLKLETKISKNRGAQVIAFVSTVPGEGKSTISMLQALYQSGTNHRTLLIDSDYRRPYLSQILTPQSKNGICELAIDEAPDLKKYIWHDQESGLDFLPASRMGTDVNAHDIFISGDVVRIVNGLRELYDYIIIDIPPILILPDARILSGALDHMIYVVEWGKVRKDTIAEALKTSPELNDLIIGSVLNKVNVKKIKRYSGYYYGSDYYDS